MLAGVCVFGGGVCMVVWSAAGAQCDARGFAVPAVQGGSCIHAHVQGGVPVPTRYTQRSTPMLVGLPPGRHAPAHCLGLSLPPPLPPSTLALPCSIGCRGVRVADGQCQVRRHMQLHTVSSTRQAVEPCNLPPSWAGPASASASALSPPPAACCLLPPRALPLPLGSLTQVEPPSGLPFVLDLHTCPVPAIRATSPALPALGRMCARTCLRLPVCLRSCMQGHATHRLLPDAHRLSQPPPPNCPSPTPNPKPTT